MTRAIRMTINNFLSYGEEVTVDLRKRGLVMVEGENRDDPTARSNGAAKSGFVEAFVWCLQGITLRGYEGDDVINNKVGKNCYVAVTLKRRKDEWMVVRSRRDDELKTGLKLFHNDIDVTGSTIADTQEQIDRLLGMTVKTFLSSVVFGQSNAYRFSQLTDKEQKAILDEALGIERFAQAGEEARDEARTWRTNVETIQRDLDRGEREEEELKEKIEDLKERHENFDRVKRKRIADLRHERSELKAKLNKLEYKDEVVIIDMLDAERESLRKAKTKLEGYKEALSELTITQRGLQSSIAKLNVTIDKHEALHGPCPTCKQDVDVDIQTRMLKEWRAERKKLSGELEKLEKTITDQEQLVRDVEVREVKVLEKTIAKREDELKEVRSYMSEVVKIKTKLRELKKRIKEVVAEESPFEDLIKKEGRKLVDLMNANKDLAMERSRAEKKAEAYEFWVDAYGTKGLRSLLIETALPVFNEKVQEYADAISEGTLRIEFKTQSELKSGRTVEKFEVAVTNKFGASTYKGNSAGEKAKIDVAVGLALQALVASRAESDVNVAFFDEPFESLDDAAIERVATMLTESLADRESVFVITHNETLKSFFPNVMTVIKEKGISRID